MEAHVVLPAVARLLGADIPAPERAAEVKHVVAGDRHAVPLRDADPRVVVHPVRVVDPGGENHRRPHLPPVPERAVAPVPLEPLDEFRGDGAAAVELRVAGSRDRDDGAEGHIVAGHPDEGRADHLCGGDLLLHPRRVHDEDVLLPPLVDAEESLRLPLRLPAGDRYLPPGPDRLVAGAEVLGSDRRDVRVEEESGVGNAARLRDVLRPLGPAGEPAEVAGEIEEPEDAAVDAVRYPHPVEEPIAHDVLAASADADEALAVDVVFPELPRHPAALLPERLPLTAEAGERKLLPAPGVGGHAVERLHDPPVGDPLGVERTARQREEEYPSRDRQCVAHRRHHLFSPENPASGHSAHPPAA